MNNELIKLTENDLYGIINELVNNLISEAGRSSYTQKKYGQDVRNEIISNAQAEVDRLRAEISNLSKKIKIAQSPEAIEQLNRQRNTLYKLRNRAVAKVWNLSNERAMTQGAKQRAAIKRRNDRIVANNTIKFSPEDIPTFTESCMRNIVKESINKVLNEDIHDYWGQENEPVLVCPYCESDNVQEIIGNDGSWDGSCKCYDCGEIFDVDSARGSNYFEPDWDAMRHESYEYNEQKMNENYMNKKLLRLTESDLHKIVKESVNRILNEGQEGYNQVMNTLNNPTAQKGLKKAWNKERKRNPNADYDTFEYNHALNLQNKKRKEDERYASVKESNLHKGVKGSVNKILNEIIGSDVITCYGTREAITRGGYTGGGSLLGDGVIYLGVGHVPEGSPYGKDLISVNVDVSNFYRAKNAQEAIAIARDNQEGYSGVLYHSHYDGDVCAVFDQSCIIGKA